MIMSVLLQYKTEKDVILRSHLDLDIEKVPGDIHISFHSYRGKWNSLKARRPSSKGEHGTSIFISNKVWNLPRSFYRYGEMPDFLSKK